MVQANETMSSMADTNSTTNTTNGEGHLASRNAMLASDHGGSIFDGERMSLHWSDMCQELVFLVPHRVEKMGSSIVICWLECADDLASIPSETFVVNQTNSSQQTSCSLSSSTSGQQETTATATATVVKTNSEESVGDGSVGNSKINNY